MESRSKRSILVINPNMTTAMTNGLQPLMDSLAFDTTHISYFTAPSGVPSINSETDAATSANACLPALASELANHDAFLVCCYSQHPLVPQLRNALATAGMDKPVTGIFEASIGACLQLIDTGQKFGIVSTGSQWETILDDAVTTLMGTTGTERYAGCKTTGLNADKLHTAPADEVDQRMKKAVQQLLQAGATAICLGCAGMAGMERTVRQACVEALGADEGRRVRIVDGVVAGAAFLEGVLRAGN